MMKLGFNFKYLLAFLALLIAIVAIALFMPGGFIRFHFGDILIVILIYCFIRILLRNRYKWLPLHIFIFATLVEIGQYFNLVYHLGLGHSEFARVAIGTTFDFLDIVMYFIGCTLIFVFDRWKEHRTNISEI
ncbi:MAG: DUF2809 domain-containing protein [Defluviitaleaceae bacterium]|nr:DUF2809 domain-containing protein [Defluviitaleaceae bacterium]